MSRWVWVRVLAAVALLAGCSNNPYPEADNDRKVFYRPYQEPPKTLDPAVSYSTAEHIVTGPIYEGLLEYHYLDRPYRLIPGLAEEVPRAEHLPDGRVRYRFVLRRGVHFSDDACFSLVGKRSRPALAADVVFALHRIADPAIASPVADPFSNLVGFSEFRAALESRRSDPAFARLPAHEQYATLGGFEGAVAQDERTLDVTLSSPYPQILYWFAITFSSPVPWEAIAYYDGEEGRPLFAEHPVGTGAFRLAEYKKTSKIVLERNPNWYGITRPEQAAPAATFPAASGADAGLAEASGRALPFLDRIEYRMEKESIPAFSKFMQGYYDRSGLARESFDRVISNGRLSEDMAARGIRLEKTVIPAIYYIGFNMDDPVVGRAGGERSRLLRQAMSQAADAAEYLRLFFNGRGLPAQSPLPPGLFGYDEAYENPYREVSLDRARELLVQAGYPKGIDPETGRPLKLSFDSADPTPDGRLRYQYWVDQWRRIGLDVRIEATTYNKFQEKVRDGAYQIFQWGWVADYPDPENFLFLLTGKMARSESGGPNTANFKDPSYDRLFDEMRTRDSDARRRQIIRDMIAIVEHERPWIELFHPEDYVLRHSWYKYVKPPGLSIPTMKYHDIDAGLRARQREEWNRPILWPGFALVALLLLVLAPGIWTFYRERQ